MGLDMNLEDEILEISRSFQVLVHTTRGGSWAYMFSHLRHTAQAWVSERFGPYIIQNMMPENERITNK
jgi:hypothetical protein